MLVPTVGGLFCTTVSSRRSAKAGVRVSNGVPCFSDMSSVMKLSHREASRGRDGGREGTGACPVQGAPE